ncbi:MAG: 1-(5-phosphoribosyl)-5-[(5-phosphoribosylamino)methylideneamino]imidazole-4-carboxamide isomerase [Elusimicrobia bacterium]|nr:1-(5-phosphoribosyl)-5-[(5-phosphoribosylamino)methylideneamino]imidazole-4-carboxamide isomerase [Elusimicrobiota bacterium]MBD3411903.1 1-(5-phosphoribosyl)-5-[(5-phosphoribosylamino)methylideneamino]imidazole-4-carboxamide isomerase [Elusimicrobiota bacterium]
MIIIPAIDIRNGSCVMLTQGKKEKERIFSPDPAACAFEWIHQGAKRLHVIDLDGAFSGKPVNIDALRLIRKKASVPVQAGGGIRSMESLAMVMDTGIEYAILGTAAIRDAQFLDQAVKAYPDRIIGAVDAYQGMVSVSGWLEKTKQSAAQVTQYFTEHGIKTVLYTDIEKDGMMQGPNFNGIKALADTSSCDIIASGGFSRIDDITRLAEQGSNRVIGVVVGKALYTKDMRLPEAINAAKA